MQMLWWVLALCVENVLVIGATFWWIKRHPVTAAKLLTAAGQVAAEVSKV